MRKQDFIKKFELQKGNKNYFRDGRTIVERVVYYNKYGNKYIFLNGDLCGVNEENHTIEASYSWYR